MYLNAGNSIAGYYHKGSTLGDPTPIPPRRYIGVDDLPSDTNWCTFSWNLKADLLNVGISSSTPLDSFLIMGWGIYWPPWKGQKVYWDDVRLMGYADYDDRRILTENELYRLFEACKKSDNPILYEIVKIAVLTGMRKDELQNFTWDDVDFERDIIRVEQTKTRHTFYKPMTEELRKVLLSLRDKVPHSHYVFSQPDGTAYGDWRRSFKTACRRAGLKDVCFHTLRHTCFSYLGMKGYSALEIQAYSGHKSLSMVQRYTHIPPSHVRTIADAIGATVVQFEKGS